MDYSKYPINWRSEIRPTVLQRDNYTCRCCKAPLHAVGYRNKRKEFIAVSGSVLLDAAGQGLSYPSLQRMTAKEAIAIADLLNTMGAHQYFHIKLVVAHLDHDESNWNVSIDRLITFCQSCHFRYDAADNQRRKREKRYQSSLFPI